MPKRPPTFRPMTPKAAYFRPPPSKPEQLAAQQERAKFYNRDAWIRLRNAFLIENPLCHDCEVEGNLIPATIAHHIIERLDRPDLAYDQDNLMPLCQKHHNRRHKRRGIPGGANGS